MDAALPESLCTETPAVVAHIHVAAGEAVAQGQLLVTTELMKMRQEVRAPAACMIVDLAVSEGDSVEAGSLLLTYVRSDTGEAIPDRQVRQPVQTERASLQALRRRQAALQDAARPDAVARRHAAGMRTARENVTDLLDEGSLIEYGAFALAAQRRKYRPDDLQAKTPADGIVTGIGTVNAATFGAEHSACAVLAVDYTVMAGTQGYFHHKKIDRILDLVHENPMPVVLFAEGGGGRPNDLDIADISFSALDVPSFWRFAQLAGTAPRVTIVAGRCFAGNAAFAATADLVIATRNSNLGMGGPAMIEGGGLGVYRPDEIGPAEMQAGNGVVDILVADEQAAVDAAKRFLSFFQGSLPAPEPDDEPDPAELREIVPEDRQLAYDVRLVIMALADRGTVLELRQHFAPGMITSLVRIGGKAMGLIANNPMHLGGAIDPDGAGKAARFLQLCDTFGLPVVSLCDTPGFMVGPKVEAAGQVRHSGRLFLAGAKLTVPLLTIVLRKAYGLGAQAMAGGSFRRPLFTVSWPTGEFGAMGLEGAVRLGARAELASIEDEDRRDAVFRQLVSRAYQRGKAINAASLCEFDAVIDPAETRSWILSALATAGPVKSSGRGWVDAF